MGSRLDHICRYVQKNGLRHTAFQAWLKTKDYYLRSYDRWYEKNKPNEEEMHAQRQRIFEKPPLISVVVPVFNTRSDYLKEMAMSVVNQTYAHWELCLLDGGSVKEETLRTLEELAKADKRIRNERAAENLGIAGNTNLAIDMAKGDYVALLDHDDTLTPDALYWVADAIERTGAEVIYSDEDKMQHEGKYLFTPHLKPDYSPDFLKSCNYFCHLMTIERELLKKIGGLMTGFDGSQDHELALRASGCANAVCHIPKVLYHWRQDANSMSHRNLEKCVDAGRRAVVAQLEREKKDAQVEVIHGRNCVTYATRGEPLISVLLWHQGDEKKKQKCIESLKKTAGYDRYEIIEATGAERAEAFNRAAKDAKGDLLLLLDSGVNFMTSGWLARWTGFIQRSQCLSVCAKMISRRKKLAFAGYVVGLEQPVVIPQKGYPADGWGYFGVKELTHNISSATWSLMLVKKTDFEALNGFDEALPALADVDWCLRASRDLNGWHTYDPYLKAMTDEKGLWTRPGEAWKPFAEKWPNVTDPYYNPQWSRKDGNYRLK